MVPLIGTIKKVFVAKGLPVLPYKNDGTYNPYPIFIIELIEFPLTWTNCPC